MSSLYRSIFFTAASLFQVNVIQMMFSIRFLLQTANRRMRENLNAGNYFV